MDWSVINQVLDEVAVTVGVVVLIVRQSQWRSADLHRMLRLPAIIVALGLVLTATELRNGFAWAPGDWVIIGEFALVAVTGMIMGTVTRFRRRQGELQYRLTTAGLWLWVLFIAIRVGSFVLAAGLGAQLADATGIILLSFGLNRLAAVVVVRRRIEQNRIEHGGLGQPSGGLAAAPARSLSTPAPVGRSVAKNDT